MNETTFLDSILIFCFLALLFYLGYKREKIRPVYYKRVSGEKLKKSIMIFLIYIISSILYLYYRYSVEGIEGLISTSSLIFYGLLILLPLLFLEPKGEFVIKLNQKSRILAIIYGVSLLVSFSLFLINLLPQLLFHHILIFGVVSSEVIGVLGFFLSIFAIFYGIFLLLTAWEGKFIREDFFLNRLTMKLIRIKKYQR